MSEIAEVEITEEAVFAKVREYLRGRGELALKEYVLDKSPSQFFDVTLKDIINFAGTHLGISSDSRKWMEKIKTMLEDLRLRSKIVCERDSRGQIKRIKVINLYESISPPKVILKRMATGDTETIEYIITPKDPSLIQRPTGRNVVFRKKGEVRRIREGEEEGDRNEGRYYKLIKQWIFTLGHWLQEQGVQMDVERTKKNNPKKGFVDVRDSWGEDVLILVSYREKNYLHTSDVKSSSKQTRLKNRKMKPGVSKRKWVRRLFKNKFIKVYAQYKKAITVNESHIDTYILQNTIDDLFYLTGIRFPLVV